MQFRKNPKPEVVINIAPLVDVVFLLVIFFAVTTSFIDPAGLKLELPESTSTATRETRDLTVLMAADGTLSFDGQSVSHDELGSRLSEALETADNKVVVLRADTTAAHGDVVRVMDVVREAGAEGLTVAAQNARD
ncbi:MAG: biopolymer transporter ExbD [bacterium]|nr:biopolymer transporter ExbD [bacterium]